MKNKFITYIISLVWIINGGYCKIMNFTPRHEEIISRILGSEYSNILTVLIGVLELLMSIWILSGYKSKINAITQIGIIFSMNIIEFVLVPDLLLWGKFNLVFALFFIGIIYLNTFVNLKKKNK